MRSGAAVGLAAGVGLVGLSVWLVAYVEDPQGALRAWLVAWTYGLSIALGSLCVVMVGYVTGGRWLGVLRRGAEATAMSLPALALGVLPVLIGLPLLYPWARPRPTVAGEPAPGAPAASGWVDPTFFSLRAILYLCVWIMLAALLWRASLLMDAGTTGSRRRRGAPVEVSATGLIVLGLTVTLATFDWLGSLAATDSSTVLSVQWFAGGLVAAVSMLALLGRGLRAAQVVSDGVADAHERALGRLLLALIVLWAFVACSLGLLVWIRSVPSDPEWYPARGGGAALVALGVMHFVLPLLLLRNHAAEPRPVPLGGLAVWLLAAHWLGMRWLVGPARGSLALLPGWADFAALVAVIGLGAACGAWMLDGKAVVLEGSGGSARSQVP